MVHEEICIFRIFWIYTYIYIYIYIYICINSKNSKNTNLFVDHPILDITLFFLWIYNNGCTTWTLTKRLEKRLDGNYTRMLRAILNNFSRQHSTRYQLYCHLPPIMKTIQVWRTRHAGHCWRSRDKLISDVLLWTPT